MKLDYKKKTINLKSIHYNKKRNTIDKITSCAAIFLTFPLYASKSIFIKLIKKIVMNQGKKFFLLFENSLKKTFN